MPRIAVGGIVHETNTFAPILTPLGAFSVNRGTEIFERWQGSHSSLGGVLQGLMEAGYQPLPLIYAAAMPSGLVIADAYHTLCDELFERLGEAGSIDGVLLVLHGAMVAQGHDDCEGEILARIRSMFNVPLVAVLDMHGSLTGQMVASADGLIAFNSNPHLDTYERGLEAVEFLRRLLDGEVTPTHAVARPPLLLNALTTGTDRLPLRAVHEHASLMRCDRRVLNISIIGGFAYSDIHDAGVSILVTTDNAPYLAQGLADELASIAWKHGESARDTGMPVIKAVQRALAARHFPVILADIGDNVGGGSPGDGTVLLRELLNAQAQDAVVVLADRGVLRQAVAAGVGAEIEIALGGKTDDWHGSPVTISVRVENLTDGQFTTGGKDHFSNIYGNVVDMEGCARLRCAGITLLVTGKKTPPGTLEQLRSQGVIPEAQKIIVVKSPIAFRGAYEPIAAEIIEVDTPGLCAASLQAFTYRKLRRPVFPLDEITSADL